MSLCPHGYTAFWDCPICEEPMGTALASHVYCLCNHTAADHGLTDDEGGRTPRYGPPCMKCTCQTFELDPIYEPESTGGNDV